MVSYDPSRDKSISARRNFFEKSIYTRGVQDCISGKNEVKCIEVLKELGYVLGRDYVRQHPIGYKFVLDFAFLEERFCIEVDGKDHEKKKQKKLDKLRDKFLYSNGWVVLRIRDEDFFGYKGSFYRFLVKELVEERRAQRNNGELYPIDIPEFNEDDYDYK